jgi:hypothetical protein
VGTVPVAVFDATAIIDCAKPGGNASGENLMGGVYSRINNIDANTVSARDKAVFAIQR